MSQGVHNTFLVGLRFSNYHHFLGDTLICTMGCLHSDVHRPSEAEGNSESVASKQRIAGISYQTKKHNTEDDKQYVQSSPSMVVHSWTRKTPPPITPSKIAKGKDGESVFSLDISAFTESYHRHWHFPRWVGHSKTCTFCGCDCHGGGVNNSHSHSRGHGRKKLNTAPVLSLATDRRKQNNLKMTNTMMCDPLGGALGTTGQLLCTNLLAMNALDLTAPASDALVKNRKNTWVQLAGHPGSFAPAGPNTIWKKRLTKDNNETVAYVKLMDDMAREIVPKFYREVEYNNEIFIEIDDLLQHFHDPHIMDIKMGTRTFLESEVKNPVLRKDLYEKMIKLAPDEPTAEEHEQKAITKLRYMQFREKGSSTSTLGFRIEAVKMSGETCVTDLKKLKAKADVINAMGRYLAFNGVVVTGLLRRFREMRQKIECSKFFKTHEIIGSSILLLYDKEEKVGAWMIDFAKTLSVDQVLNHRLPWVVGNHEDGYLNGLDGLIEVFMELEHQIATHSYDDSPLDTSEGKSNNKTSELSLLKKQNNSTSVSVSSTPNLERITPTDSQCDSLQCSAKNSKRSSPCLSVNERVTHTTDSNASAINSLNSSNASISKSELTSKIDNSHHSKTEQCDDVRTIKH